MASVENPLNAVLDLAVESAVVAQRAAPAQLLRLLAVSSSSSRRALIREAADASAWDAILCRDAGEFLRAAFRHSVPLVIVDLPERTSPEYWSLERAAEQVRQLSTGLVMVLGRENEREEIWARSLGAWAYLPVVCESRELEVALCDARIAVSRMIADRRASESWQAQSELNHDKDKDLVERRQADRRNAGR